MRQFFFIFGITALIITTVIYLFFDVGLLFILFLIILLLIGYANTVQLKHAIIRNFPVL